MKRLFILTICWLALGYGVYAFAQDKPQPKASEKPVTPETKTLPEVATVSAEEVKNLEQINLRAQLATTQADNLELRIEKAQRELVELKASAKKAADEANNAYFAALGKAGIPRDKVTEYDAKQEPDKSLKFTRRPPAKKD